MILARAARMSLMACLAVMATQAKADVLQIDAEGARWVSGALAADQSVTASGAQLRVDGTTEGTPEGTVASERIVSDPSRHAAGVPAQYAAKVHELSARFDLSPSLIEALVWQESRWRPNAVSPAGARGLAQLMPGTARYLGVDPDDPYANLEGGARYLREQLDRFGGDLEKALAAYNAGPGRVERAGGIPNIRETKLYVASIIGRLANHSRSPVE